MYYLKRNHDATRNFWKCAKRSNNFGLQWPSTCFGLNRDFARGIVNRLLPVHILHAISLLSQQIEPSNQYLSYRDILFLLFVG